MPTIQLSRTDLFTLIDSLDTEIEACKDAITDGLAGTNETALDGAKDLKKRLIEALNKGE